MPKTPDPTRLVADADVLAADLFINGVAREALSRVRTHSWLQLVASEPLLEDATGVIAHLGDRDLADAWYSLIEAECHLVEHPEGDHPALASAYGANAGQLLTYDDTLTSAQTGISMRRAMPISIRTPDAFVTTVEIADLYEANVGETYPGPDGDPAV